MFQRLIRYSFYSLFILVPLVFLPFTSELFEFNKIIITYSLTILIVAFWIARMVTNKHWIFRRTPLDIPLLLFLGVILLSLFFSIDIHTSWFGYYSRWNGGFLSILSYSLLYWAFVSNMTRRDAIKTLQMTLGSAILVSLWGFAEHFGIDAGWWVQDVKNRVFSTLGQPNWLAAYLTALVFIPISFALPDKKSWVLNNKTLGLLGTSTLLFTVLLFTRSRSGLLAFGISSILFWGYYLIKLKTKAIKPILIFGLIGASLSLIFPNPVRELVFKTAAPAPKASGDTVLEVGGTESGNIRKIVWTGAIRIWQGSTKNFLLGTGPETFAMAYYQYRPVEHNQTTEWELLYNKAHNEFLNYLSTTGLLGLASYLLLLIIMAKILISKHDSNLIFISLLCGWLTISITNFLGFSVVAVQILLFLLPAIAISLNQPDSKESEASPTGEQIMAIILLCGIPAIILLTLTGRYWLADTKLASSQKQSKYFQATQASQYLLLAYQDATSAYQLNGGEPVIASELSNSAAYLSLALANQSTASAKQLAQISLATSDQAIQASPHHPNYYKSRARSLILLSDLDNRYLKDAAITLDAATKISPTDPRLPYNLGIVYKYLDEFDQAKIMFEKSLELKPDFADPKKQLEDMQKDSTAK